MTTLISLGLKTREIRKLQWCFWPSDKCIVTLYFSKRLSSSRSYGRILTLLWFFCQKSSVFFVKCPAGQRGVALRCNFTDDASLKVNFISFSHLMTGNYEVLSFSSIIYLFLGNSWIPFSRPTEFFWVAQSLYTYVQTAICAQNSERNQEFI